MVHIGNTVAEVRDDCPSSGLMKSGKLLQECSLAHYETPDELVPRRTDHGDHIFWVSVALHPHLLAKRILGKDGDSHGA
jgi:hypothetical protein